MLISPFHDGLVVWQVAQAGSGRWSGGASVATVGLRSSGTVSRVLRCAALGAVPQVCPEAGNVGGGSGLVVWVCVSAYVCVCVCVRVRV